MVRASQRATLPPPGAGAPAAGASSSGCAGGPGVTLLASLLTGCFSAAALRTTKLCCSCAKIRCFALREPASTSAEIVRGLGKDEGKHQGNVVIVWGQETCFAVR